VVGDLDVIVGTRLCVGLAAGALMAIGVTMVGDYLPEHKRAGTIGMLSALNMVTSLVSLPAAGFVGEEGWRPAFLLYLAIVPVIVLASPSRLPAPRKPFKSATARAGRQWWRLDLPWGLLALALAIGIILTIPGIYVSFHLATIGLGKTSTVAVMMMGNSLLAAVFSSIFGKATRRYSWKLIFCIAFSTMGIGLIMLAFAHGIWVAIPALLLMGAGMGWLAPGIMAKAVDSVEEGRRGTVVGAVQGASAVAPLVGLSLLEPLQIGTTGVMLLVGLLSVALFLGYALAPSDRPAKD
jgi:MFS family permease